MKENVKWMGISNSFAAGVFLAIGLTHLLPEAHETFEELLNKDKESEDRIFPYPFFICVLRCQILRIN
jgi:zinc transporter ZupT